MRNHFCIVGIVLLAACSNGSGDSLPLLTGSPHGTTSFSRLAQPGSSLARGAAPDSYKLLYSFEGVPDGAYPLKRLLNVDGVLYGTTNWGGTPNRGSGGEQTGTVFKWSASHGESIVHVFHDFPDGRNPVAGLINVKGDLYGTTVYGGGPKQRGTVFKVSTSGVESVLYRFSGPHDGIDPESGLTYVNGLLYGTTALGGSSDCFKGCGTIYSVSLSGNHKVLYRFKSGNDGASPQGNLIYRSGKFYGTAGAGDYSNHGVVFEMTPSGVERVIYHFKGEPDGSQPVAGMIDVNGTFYGTTAYGGTRLGGTVFKLDRSGHESVVYSFARNSIPEGGLLYDNAALYGTTTYGGPSGHGTVFKLTLGGKGTIIYNFKGTGNGKNPTGGLIRVNDRLYGTTSRGGISNMGCVFSVSP
jgi:uncharacterized repeat protein (TIGR03803 family)